MSAAQQDPQPAPAAPTDAPGAAIVAHAAAEAAVPDADTANARECPFCVMMRQGGCEVAFRVRGDRLHARDGVCAARQPAAVWVCLPLRAAVGVPRGDRR